MQDELLEFLPCETPVAWLNAASANLEILLVDHANCEKKAAATAMNLLYRHVGKTELLVTMSRLAREELLHFQQVVGFLKAREIPYRRLGPSRYAAALRRHIDYQCQDGLIDTLVIGALVEARSCERFIRLASRLDEDLARFYRGLARSEARHFRDYLDLAGRYSRGDLSSRIHFFREIERDLVLTEDRQLRFHSGVPAEENCKGN